MRLWTEAFFLALVATVMMAIPGMAQNVEPPFTWEGEGRATYITEGGTDDIDFQLKLSIDEQGMFKGQTSNEDGSSRIKHVFYTEPKQYSFPGFFTRDVVIVLMFNEYSDSPMLSILNGRFLMDKFFYGEVMLAQYAEGSDTARGLGIGNTVATQMEQDQLPESLKSALKNCLPIGVVKIEGDYTQQETSAAAGGDSIALFNGRDLQGWHTYLKDANADPEQVWQARDGALWCSGNPTGFIRTTNEYSDYKLVFEWRWPEKPSNSGVLLHMSDEEKIWPLCMEAQLMHKRAGDFVGMGCDFNENKGKAGEFIRYAPRMNDSNEKEPGGWNTYEIVCKGDTIELKINGQLQNKATGVGLRRGYIGLQSEGAPIVFRNIKLTPLR
jgi:hypothetical protein